jgi:hypothetical protein
VAHSPSTALGEKCFSKCPKEMRSEVDLALDFTWTFSISEMHASVGLESKQTLRVGPSNFWRTT